MKHAVPIRVRVTVQSFLSRASTRRPALLLITAALVLTLSPAAVAPSAAPGVRGAARLGGKPLANAVVWLEAPDLPSANLSKRAVLDQRNLAFSPHVLAVRVGTTVDFPNDDRVFHNVFSFRDGKVFNLGLYPVGTSRPVKFDRVGLSRIFCNIHPNMAAYVMAVDSPYFAVSDRDGSFTLPDVAPRTYTYRAWRPGGDEISGTWASATGSLTADWP
jgi:plastocyanin